jgi:hypothetical protein
MAFGVYVWNLNSYACAQARQQSRKHLGSSIRDTLDFYRGEPLALITQATVFAAIHIFFNVLVVSFLLMQPLQGVAFGTTVYGKSHAFSYADGCVPYSSDYRNY